MDRPGMDADLETQERVEMEGTLTRAGLPTPPVPDTFRAKMHQVHDWCWATRAVEPFDMYRFDRYLVEAVVEHPDDYMAFCHAGHGVNSYALTYQIVLGRIALFVQIGWGGAYMDAAHQVSSLTKRFEECGRLLTNIPSDGSRLLVAISDLRGHRLCGWVPAKMSKENARDWLRSRHLVVEDPFVSAQHHLLAAS